MPTDAYVIHLAEDGAEETITRDSVTKETLFEMLAVAYDRIEELGLVTADLAAMLLLYATDAPRPSEEIMDAMLGKLAEHVVKMQAEHTKAHQMRAAGEFLNSPE